jgi:hypothetical protein
VRLLGFRANRLDNKARERQSPELPTGASTSAMGRQTERAILVVSGLSALRIRTTMFEPWAALLKSKVVYETET